MKAGMIVDSFAGGGGASLGITWGLGRSPDIAINHDAAALAMHAANHPSTKHVREDIWKTDLRKLVGKKHVQLLWASPDCRHFSRAKGGKPVSKKIRSLAWICCKWADQVKPDVIMLENVREFADWGPLVPLWTCQRCGWKGTEGQATLARKRRCCQSCDSVRLKETEQQIPDPKRKGLTFRRWVGRLRNLGYEVQWKTLDAADFGAPTHRRRLFLVARRDGQPIVWPEPTHADPKKLDDMPLFGKPKPWRTAAECIDWSLACPSIFDRKKPLADKTLRRIALGLMRYVIENPQPFIVGVGGPGYSGKPRPTDKPMHTLIQENHAAVVTPYVTPVAHAGERRSHPMDEPMPTVTGAHRGEHALTAATLMQYYGAKSDGDCRSGTPERPLNVVPTENRHAVVAAMLKHYGGVVGHTMDKPLGTVTSIDHHSLMSASIVGVGGRAGQSPPTSPNAPLGTVTAKGDKAVAAAHLVRFNHGDKQWNGVDEPTATVTSQGNKFGLVYAFLVKYFGTAIGQDAGEPLHTVTGKHRFGVVMVEVAQGHHEPAVAIDVPGIGQCVIADIGLRMLTPRELARAQGFPDTYILTGNKSQQVAKIGNSVPPHLARAMVEANCPSFVAA